MLKEHMAKTVGSTSQTALIEAMGYVFGSQQEALYWGSGIATHIRNRFIAATGLIFRSVDPRVCWAKGRPILTDIDIQKLEDDVIAEMIAKENGKKRTY
jgi:hypothetical protein